MKIPSNNQWTQLNDGDIHGILHETQNLTFDKKGKLKLSRKAFNRYNSGNNANLGYSLGLTYYDDQYLALTDDSIFQYDFGGDAVSEITGGTPALNSDLQVIYGLAYFTEDANLSSFNGSTVTSSLYSLTTGVPHPMTVFDSFTTFKLAIGDGNLVHVPAPSKESDQPVFHG